MDKEGALFIVHYYYPSGTLMGSRFVQDEYELWSIIDGRPSLISINYEDPDPTLPHKTVCYDWMEQQRTTNII